MNSEANKIAQMRTGGHHLATIVSQVVGLVKSGQTGLNLDAFAEKAILNVGGRPAFKFYRGYPNTLCVSVNDQIVHGIPNNLKFKVGDIVSLDLGMWFDGFCTDMAVSIIVDEHGPITVGDLLRKTRLSAEEKLLVATFQSLEKGIAAVKAGHQVGDISAAVQGYLESNHLGIVRDLVGHGVGVSVHDEPSIPNFGKAHTGPTLFPDQTIAIEPMATLGDWRISVETDGWTVRTHDHSLAAHFEHTVLVTKEGSEILTV